MIRKPNMTAEVKVALTKISLTPEEFVIIEQSIAYCIGKRKQYGLKTKPYTEVLNRLEEQYINSIDNERNS